MYPFFRLLKEVLTHRAAPPLQITDTHVSHHICWPWDLDLWNELNNGRTLTLFDLGRIPLTIRMGAAKAVRTQRWGMAIAGATVRYRRRVRGFDRIEMHSRALGWDARFIYIEQSMWVRGEAASHVLLRTAITDKNGIVSTDRVAAALGLSGSVPVLPAWVEAYSEAEALRPWPPSREATN